MTIMILMAMANPVILRNLRSELRRIEQSQIEALRPIPDPPDESIP